MDLLFSVQRKIESHTTAPVNTIPTICRISSCNILAFSTSCEINEISSGVWGTHVYVCDIGSPWHTFKVTSSKNCITSLEWDVTGKFLLIADTEGEVQIWVQKDNLLSQWLQLYSIPFPGERIIKAAFYHNGRKIIFASEKREALFYMEKFRREVFPPSVRQFGGVAAQGCLILTATGLVGAFLIPLEQLFIYQHSMSSGGSMQGNTPFVLKPVTHSLGLSRTYFTTATISYGKDTNFNDGHFRIAIANGEKVNTAVIQCFKVNIKLKDGILNITSRSLPSFFLYEGAGRDLTDLKITHLSWTLTEDADSLIVVAKSTPGCFIEVWSLIDKVTPLHKLFQNKKTESFKTIGWSSQNSFRQTSFVTDISISKISSENSYVYVTMTDNSVQILTKDLKRIACAGIPNQGSDDMSFKQPRIGTYLTAHDVTYLGHVIISIDNHGQIYSFKIPQLYQEHCNNQLSLISNITSYLEYSIVTGYDASDVFLSIRPNLLDNVIEKFTENFTRQPSSVQQYYYVNFLSMKTNLYRLSVSGQFKAYDLISLLMLHSILIAFKSLLRPSVLPSQDKGPAENLALVLSESVPDVDKVLLNLDAKDFTVEPSTLQSLQQLIQWVADLALNILARLPQNGAQPNQSKNIGYDISKDIVALNSIRELLVMIRIWGLLNTLCLPVFSKSVENLDILATLFRLLTRLALNPFEPDEMLLDECCLLPSQVLIPQMQSVSTINSICSPILHLNPIPLQFTFNTEPDCLRFWNEISPIDESLSSNVMVDGIRNLLLGKSLPVARRCVRCGTYSSIGSVGKTAAMKAWEQRWASNCRCGGSWYLQKN